MRGWILPSLVIFIGAIMGCGSSVSGGQSEDAGPSTAPTKAEAPAANTTETTSAPETTAKVTTEKDEHATQESFALRTREIPLQNPTIATGFGFGSLWTVDLGDYECDDTNVVGGAAACAGPQTIFLRAMSPQDYNVSSTVPFKGYMDASVAFGSGSVWVSAISQNPSYSSLFRVDPATGEVLSRLPIKSALTAAFGEGSVWVTSEERGVLVKVDPETGEKTAEIKVSAGGANDVVVGEGSVWVASWGPASGPARQDRFGGKKIIRVDSNTGEVVAEIPIEPNALEGGASSVSVDGETGAVWVTSVNGKLIRIDPETNRIVAEVKLGDYAWKVETFAGDAWAIYETGVDAASGTPTQGVARIDSVTNQVVGSIEAKDAIGFAPGRDVPWLTTSNMEKGTGTLTRIVP